MDADDDADVNVEVEEDGEEAVVHPTSLDNKTPAFLIQHYQTAVVFLQNYGWYIVIAVIILMFIRRHFEPYLRRLFDKMEQRRETYVDPDVAERRLEAMESHRQRLQEEFDAKAARFAEEQKKKEEEKRKAKIEDWDRHLMGEGYRSRTRHEVTPSYLSLHYLAMSCHRPPYPTIPYPTLPYPTLPYPTLPYPTLPYPTLPYPVPLPPLTGC
ncbi:hypothetical protein NP493_1022g00001 [Ridgeia piscesae]|uniref:Selenoprotein S n=1 Tax=Ridgeia piscesae TaxID=27915 RepID=A0AAD9KIC2_RIDPI|nr:hypothetical protein NP493_1022g00001 [Ridgeia piscesae]